MTRALHFAGTTLSLLIAVSALALRRPILLVPALICGYAFAWVGHFFFEQNRPATFRYPLLSFMGDGRLWWDIVTGRIAF